MPAESPVSPRRRLLALAAVLYAPLILLGYGSDYDSYGVVRAGRTVMDGGLSGYDHSRNPGYLVHEVATGLLDALGGSILSNLGTVAMTLVALWGFHTVLQRLRVPHAGLLALAFVVQPYVWVNAAATIDYLWALGFLMAGWVCLLDRRWGWAGLLFALALGSRISSVLVVLPLLAAIVVREPEARRGALTTAALALGLGALCYVPPALVAGSVGALFQPAGMEGGDWSWPMRLARFGYKSATLWGLPATLLLGLGLGIGFRRTQDRRWALLGVCAVVVGLVAALYLRYPLERAYLLPAVPFVLIAFGSVVPSRRWVLALVVLSVVQAFVRLELAQPERPGAAQGGTLGVWVEPGVLVEDIHRRLALRDCEDTACWLRVMEPAPTPGPAADRP